MLALQQIGRIHAALFADDMLYLEMISKASFWLQQKYYGVDISKLYGHSVSGYFSQVRGSTLHSHADILQLSTPCACTIGGHQTIG